MDNAMPNKRLGYLVFRPNGSFDSKILTKPMNEAVRTEFDRITSIIPNVRPVMFAAQMAQRNLRELAKFERRGTTPKAFGELTPSIQAEAAFNHKIDAARHILNFLCSFRAFLDHCDEYLCTEYGKTSKQREGFKQETNHQFDSRFAYRFSWKLRNFAQHFSIPISNDSITSSMDHGAKHFMMSSKLLLERDDLLRWDEWGKLQNELKAMPNEFEIFPILDEVGVSINELCVCALRPESERLIVCWDYLCKVCDLIGLEENAIPVVWVGERAGPGLPPKSMEFLPIDELRLIIRSMGAPI